MDYAIGVDIGVSNIKSACVRRDGAILDQQQVPTHAETPDWPKRVSDHVRDLIHTRGPTDKLCIAAPGIAAPDATCITWMQGRLSEVQNLNWTQHLGWP